MPFQLSPGVAVVEKDFTSIVPSVATSTGGFAGTFQWGPVLEPVTINSENVLVQRFGKPTDDNATSFFTAANFLSYSNDLLVVRADTINHRNAVAIQSGTVTGFSITTAGAEYISAPTIVLSAPNIDGGIQATATATVTDGHVTNITITNPGTGYTSNPTVVSISAPPLGGTQAVVTFLATEGGVKINNTNDYLTSYANGAGVVGEFAAKYPGSLGNSITVYMADSDTYDSWDYKDEFDSAPGTSAYVENAGGSDDELHILIVDTMGQWTGVAGSTLEKFAFVSKASDAKKSDGTNNYYRDVLNSRSKYVWWMDHPTVGTNWGNTALGTSFATLVTAYDADLSGGVDDLTATDGQLMTAWSTFADDGQYDVRLLPLGKASSTVANSVIAIAESRADCVVFASPQDVDNGDIIIATGSEATDKIIAYRNELPSSSYAVLDSGFKYQYDRYNDKYRWVPLNGDVAGLCARVDYQNDPWFSPGGLNRGQIKNVVKLAVNPTKTDRDNLYKNGVNPVVTFPGQGTVLYGDKTLLAKPSAFDRINVRRLFIVLEKSIATAAKFQLFEFNDSFTRAQFRNLVEPFLRDVQGRRGITDFVVKCDDTNNTGEVIDANQFVADIFIKPNRSINFITLNFVAARSSVAFSEIGGGQ
jgi:phage tail sheath protein FI